MVQRKGHTASEVMKVPLEMSPGSIGDECFYSWYTKKRSNSHWINRSIGYWWVLHGHSGKVQLPPSYNHQWKCLQLLYESLVRWVWLDPDMLKNVTLAFYPPPEPRGTASQASPNYRTRNTARKINAVFQVRQSGYAGFYDDRGSESASTLWLAGDWSLI